MEKRYIPMPLEVRQEEGKPTTITAYAALYNTLSSPLRMARNGRTTAFRERIAPGAFVLSPDIMARYNHDALLGRTSSGTVQVSVDERGLKYTITIDPNDPDHTRVLAKIARGDVRGSSFAFDVAPGGEMWGTEGNERIRELRSIRIHDVGPVDKPAYPGTEGEGAAVALRSEDIDASPPEEVVTPLFDEAKRLKSPIL
jgi:hypothetical protein